jgi:RNA polymerase sigma factor (sigma-70 family)
LWSEEQEASIDWGDVAMSDLLDMVEEYQDRLHAFIRRRVGSEEDSWDVLQDVFMALTTRWNLGDAFDDAAAWLFRVARNRIVDLYRRKCRDDLPLEVLMGLEEGEAGELEDPAGSSPESEEESSELRRRLLRTLRDLPPEQRDILKLTELQGWRFEDIARETGIPMGTLLARKRYAVQKLRKVMRSFEREGKGDGKCTERAEHPESR